MDKPKKKKKKSDPTEYLLVGVVEEVFDLAKQATVVAISNYFRKKRKTDKQEE